jgi:hypothetical protein
MRCGARRRSVSGVLMRCCEALSSATMLMQQGLQQSVVLEQSLCTFLMYTTVRTATYQRHSDVHVIQWCIVSDLFYVVANGIENAVSTTSFQRNTYKQYMNWLRTVST